MKSERFRELLLFLMILCVLAVSFLAHWRIDTAMSNAPLPCPCEERGEEKEPELDLPRWPKGVVR